MLPLSRGHCLILLKIHFPKIIYFKLKKNNKNSINQCDYIQHHVFESDFYLKIYKL